ncbi:MAG: hypothetical protein ABMB14_09025 [Myxococcota bacterium]
MLIALLEPLCLFGLLAAAFHFRTDPWTSGALVVVGVSWLLYATAALRWRRQVGSAKEALVEALTGRAEGLAVRIEAEDRLELGAATQLIEDAETRTASWNPPGWLSTGQAVLVSLGLVGTFLGLTLGLVEAVPKLQGSPEEMQGGMQALLGGAQLAFVKSLAGVACAMIWSLRFRNLERIQVDLMHEAQRELANRFPIISAHALLVHELRALLVDQQSAAERSRAAASDRVVVALGETRHALIVESERATEEVKDHLQQLADALPEKIGANTGAIVAQSLEPTFQELAAQLRDLSQTGGRAIGATLHASMGAEISTLQSSLAQVAATLQQLPSQLAAGWSTADERVQRGAATAAQALADAGAATSTELRGAAAELSGGSKDFQAALLQVRTMMEETESTMGRISGFGQQLERGLSVARDVAGSLESQAQAFQLGAAEVSRPLTEVASALAQVAPRVREATAAMAAEKDALQGLGQQLEDSAGLLEGRIREYQRLQATLASEWATHLVGVDQVLMNIKKAWDALHAAAEDGEKANAQRLAEYALRIQESLRLPRDLQSLKDVLEELTDVLGDLGTAVKERR